MFTNYTESGTPLLTDPDARCIGSFLLERTSTTIANTIRRCILTETRSAGFRADLTNQADPGVKIRRNTSVIFNEMLAHRLTLLPLGVRRLDEFEPGRYECVLRVKNERRGPITPENMLHVRAGDFVVRERGGDGQMSDLPPAAAAAMFPADPITRDTALLVSLRPQWSAEQPAEELDLTAFPVVGRGRDFMGFCPVSQCSFANTPDPDPVRQERFFYAWLADYKKMTDPAAATSEQLGALRAEWETMAVQRCFLVDERGQPNSFIFTVESVGIRPVQEIVAEGIRAAAELVAPYAEAAERPAKELGITVHPTDSRMSSGLDLTFADQEHTLGNLLQTIITELYLDAEAPDSPITYCGYKVRHPLERKMTLRIGIREGAKGEPAAVALQAVATAAAKARALFDDLGRSWAGITGAAAGAPAAAPELDG
jgi:DNA-directed RNA polymerase subunit L